jgi:DNA polymerase-3 subunit epsilon
MIFRKIKAVMQANTVVVLDFETSGMSPDYGDRAIEIGAVKMQGGIIVDEFQSLMNPGFRINGFIENFTGIDNAMLDCAPNCAQVMADFQAFLGDANLVAHNASFDKRFLDAEFNQIKAGYVGKFACSMLLARRIYQEAPNHKLGTLVSYRNIQNDGVFHRALADAQMTAKLWLAMLEDVGDRYQCWDTPFSFIEKVSRAPKKSVGKLLSDFSVR